MSSNGWFYYKKVGQARDNFVEHIRQVLDLTTGVRPVSDGTIPPELRKEDWGDGSTTNDTYNYDAPNYINYNNYQTNNNYSRNKTVFNSYNQITNVTIIDPRIPPKVERKPSKLPIEELGQTDTKTSDGKPIKLAKALEEKEYGRLIASPFSTKEIKLRKANDGVFNSRFEAAKESGLNKFLAYFLDEKTENLVDSICLAVPEFGRGFYGKLSLTFGADSLRLYSNYLGASSLNALMGVNDTIPKSYKVVNYNPPFSDEKIEIKDFVLDVNSDNLRRLILGDTDGVEINWEDWLENAVNNQRDNQDKPIAIPISDLAQLIRNNLASLYYRLGLNQYPITVPETLNQDLGEGNNQAEKTKKITNLSEYQLWLIQALDSVLGQFPIKIRIEDNDLIKTGNQGVDITLPNLAETLAELAGKSISQQAMIDALINITLRNLGESGLNRQLTIQNHYIGLANLEYLGYEIKQKLQEVDFLFNPEIVNLEEADQTIDKALKPTKIKIPTIENTDKDTLEKHMQQLLYAAAITRAVNFRGFKAGEDIASKFTNMVKNSRDLFSNFTDDELENLENFINSFETGFSDKSGSVDPTKPWGNTYENRPKFKKLG